MNPPPDEKNIGWICLGALAAIVAGMWGALFLAGKVVMWILKVNKHVQ